METQTIENDLLKISVRQQGAELISFFDKENNIEHLWKADPAIWPWHAPTLFPVVGRCMDDEILIDGKAFKMPQHGFARRSDFELINSTRDSLTWQLTASENTLAAYPYHFDLQISYLLKKNSLTQSFEVKNTGRETMYFQLGAHPGFAVPFLYGETYEDCFIEFDKDEILDRENIDANGFFDGSVSNVINGTNRLTLEKDMFSKDAIVMKDLQSRKLILGSVKNPHKLSVEFPAFHYLGLWAKVNAPYICIEPWIGCADTEGQKVAFKYKEGIVPLPAGDKFRASIIISIS